MSTSTSYEYAGEAISCGAEGHIYVTGISAGGVKVGRTSAPTSRIRQHERSARAFGSVLIGPWVSPPHQEHQQNERLLINWCQDRLGIPRRQRTEYFALDLDDVVGYARSLPMTRANVAAYEAKVESGLTTLKAIFLGGRRHD